MIKFRSQYEAFLASFLTSQKQTYAYEAEKLSFTQPEIQRKYTPDFWIADKDFFIEAKGLFSASDRKKHLWVREANPDIDIRFVFQNAQLPIRKGSRTTCKDWAEKHGFEWAHKVPPLTWIQ